MVVTLVYVLITLVFLYLVPYERIDSREAFAALAGEALFGRVGGVVFTLIVIVTVLGSLAALLMAMPRVYFAMARDRLFFPSVAALHPRYWHPRAGDRHPGRAGERPGGDRHLRARSSPTS